MLVIRGTKKLRDRMKHAPVADRDVSTTSLGDWFATALFWRPQVALLVNQRTLLPLFVELAPTNDRSVVGVMNEFAFHGEYLWKDGLRDLEAPRQPRPGMGLRRPPRLEDRISPGRHGGVPLPGES